MATPDSMKDSDAASTAIDIGEPDTNLNETGDVRENQPLPTDDDALRITPEPDPEPTPAPEPTEDPTPEPEGEAPEAGSSLQDWARDLDPRYKATVDKYGNDAEMMIGLLNAQQLIGQRNEDAELGRMVRPRQQEIVDFLDGKAKAPEKLSEEPKLPTREQVAGWEAAIGANPENPPREAAEGYRAELKRSIDFARDFRENPGKFIGGAVKQELDERQKVWDAQGAQHAEHQRAQVEMVEFREANKSWLWPDGDMSKPFTPAGNELSRIHTDELAAQQDRGEQFNPVAALRSAHWRFRAEQAEAAVKQLPSKTAPPTAGRKSKVAKKPNTGLDYAELDRLPPEEALMRGLKPAQPIQ